MAQPPQKPPHVGTIGENIRQGHGVYIYCENPRCLHGAPVDLLAIRGRYGDDFSVADFMARSVCSQCGGRWPNISIRVSPEGNREGMGRGD